MMSTAGELKVVTVTSAESGEGKSSTLTNIAVVMAQLGKRVLLVDGDLRRPRLHQIFGHTPEGFTGARYRLTSDGRRINIDIGIEESNGGNLGYLEVRGRIAIAHYFQEDGSEIVEVLGEAPVIRHAKRSPETPKPEPVPA